MTLDPYRIRRILDLLAKYWVNNPDLRLGQIIVGLTPTTPQEVGAFEDHELEKKLREALKEKDHGPTKVLPQQDRTHRVHRR